MSSGAERVNPLTHGAQLESSTLNSVLAMPDKLSVACRATMTGPVTAPVVIGLRMQPATTEPPRVVQVNVIEDSAKGGPKIIATAIVPLR